MYCRGMSTKQKFRVSANIKDIIGRDLITNDFVALFELVKNSFDAYADRVQIEFHPNRIVVVDDGKGMSRRDVTSKWLFVAYSAKKEGSEDEGLPKTYRDAIAERRGYAGNKGIGRFSCDRLGTGLDLYSRVPGGSRIQHLSVDWKRFEGVAEQEFGTVEVDLDYTSAFPSLDRAEAPTDNGTVLVITGLRDDWSYDKIDRLRSYLAKLVDPFETTASAEIVTYVVNEDWPGVEGPVGNELTDLLDWKTTRIRVEFDAARITSWLYDRGELIYKIDEPNPYPMLRKARIKAQLYFLNRSAKHTFTSRMGVQPVSFGNVFLFVNGFRIFPVGEPNDDTFGIGRRKQQGHSRYLGLRDVLGKVEVEAPPTIFQEASSRDAGLIGKEAAELYDAVLHHVLIRLEKYVVPVTWVDPLDADRDNVSGLKSDAGKARIVKAVQALVGAKDIRLLKYSQDLVDIVNERSTDFEQTMAGLAIVAEKAGDSELLSRVEASRRRFEELRAAEEEAREVARIETEARVEAEERARTAELKVEHTSARLELIEGQNRLLVGLQGRDNEELTLLHHQAIIYATEVQSLVRRGLRRLAMPQPPIEQVAADLEQISFQNSRILAVTRLATQANFRLKANELDADIVQFIGEYIEEVSALYVDPGFASFDAAGMSLSLTFKPIDVSIVVDNLISNARKAKASKMDFKCRRASTGRGVEIVVGDDGRGLAASVDPERIFDKGYGATTAGSGLGLYHVRQVLEAMGGTISLDPERQGNRANFVIRIQKMKARG